MHTIVLQGIADFSDVINYGTLLSRHFNIHWTMHHLHFPELTLCDHVLHCIALHGIALHYMILHCIAWYCILKAQQHII
jgi:hypothetical protein